MADAADDTQVGDLATVTVASSNSKSAVRHPRAIIKVGDATSGQSATGWINWTVTNNSFFEADTFRVSFAITAFQIPSGTQGTTTNFDTGTTSDGSVEDALSWLFAQTELFAEVLSVVNPTNPDNPDPSEMQSLIYGRVDDIEFDPFQRTLNLTGRDLTAVFIDSKVSDQYVNKTSSQIAQILAAKHPGMTAVVTPTKTRAGTYYEKDQVLIQASRSEWDLLCYLARKEAYVVYVSGRTLYFQPDPTDTDNPYSIVWQPPNDTVGYPTANVQELTFQRSLTVAKGITVTARSANRTTGKPTVQSYPSNPKAIQAGKASPFGNTVAYSFTMGPDHTPTEVQAFAKAKYDAIVQHEMKMTARLPADQLMSIARALQVSGTDTPFDQLYYPRIITREMSLDEGYEMTVEAQNVNPDTNPQF